MAFWRACLGAYDAARAAVVFQRGHNRAEYELALPAITRFYSIIRRDSDVSFSVDNAARLELEWWIVHRQRAQYSPEALPQSLAALQAAIYARPESLFTPHANARAEAMLLRDRDAEAGAVPTDDWNRIRAMLEFSWTSLQSAVSH